MIALIDHGVGNLRSVQKALSTVGAETQLTWDPNIILEADKIVLPGVGAFADAMNGLKERGLVNILLDAIQSGVPTLGICVGMQMLFDFSEEHGEHPGLGLIPGRVRKFDLTSQKIPQTGWNQVISQNNSGLLKGLEYNNYAYFNHSYYCDPKSSEDVLAVTDYGILYASVVGRGNLYGVQFHPEKSQEVGLLILRNFVTLC